MIHVYPKLNAVRCLAQTKGVCLFEADKIRGRLYGERNFVAPGRSENFYMQEF